MKITMTSNMKDVASLTLILALGVPSRVPHSSTVLSWMSGKATNASQLPSSRTKRNARTSKCLSPAASPILVSAPAATVEAMQGSKAKISDVGAIGFAFAGFTFWVLTDTSVKLIGQTGLPAYEMVAFLGLFMAISMVVYGVVARRPRNLRPRRISLQVVRACLDMTNNVCVVIALRHLTLTLFYILVFMAPMLIALLSTIFLREGLHWKKTAALVAGFAGVVIAVHPWSSSREGDWIGFTACMICVVCFSINMVWSRVLTQTEPPESLTLFSGLVTAVVGFGLMLLVNAQPLSTGITMGLFAMGLFCALGTLCFYTAVKHTSAANVSQFHYTQLITGTLVSYLVWHDRPGIYVMVGGLLILGSGLYIAMAAREVVPLTEGA